jgi:RNA polymerase sigma factor (sigma-70 family)
MDAAALYVAHRELLLYVAGRKFNVPETDCEPLLHDAVLALLRMNGRVGDPKAWLIAAVCNASRAYWRARARMNEVEGARIEEIADTPGSVDVDRIEREILVREVLRQMERRDRGVLRLHYYEQLTAREIAERLRTTTRYAEKLIAKALRRARTAYQRLSAPRQAPLQTKRSPGLVWQRNVAAPRDREEPLGPCEPTSFRATPLASPAAPGPQAAAASDCSIEQSFRSRCDGRPEIPTPREGITAWTFSG